MKTTISENNKSSNANLSKPFFSKNGEGSFFSQSIEPGKSFFTPSFIQPKLTIGEAGDKYEQEADAVADKVVQKLETPGASPIFTPPDAPDNNKQMDSKANPIQSGSIHSRKSFPLVGDQLKEKQDSIDTSSGIESKLTSSGGQGASPPKSMLNSMETAFGTDFKDVRLHTGQNAIQMNEKLGAQAFTHGQNIYFNKGKLNTETKEGKHLLAHELTHTIQQGGKNQSIPGVSKTNSKSIQALPAVTGITVPTEIGVGKNIRASAVLAAGTPRRTALTWSLLGAPAGVTAQTTGRQISIRASAASLPAAGAVFQIRCNVTGTPGDAFISPNITLVGVTAVTFIAAPAFANQMVAWRASQIFPPNTADPNRDGVAGNTATVNVVTAPAGRPTTITLRRRQGATVAGNIVTPGRSTGIASVRVTDNATQTFNDQNLIINPIPLNLSRFTAQVASPSGTYGAWNTIGWRSSDQTGLLNRVVGETIMPGGRDDFGYTASINAAQGGPNAAPMAALAAPANAWADNLHTGSGPNAGAAGDANMINVNRYVGPGVAARLPRIWILRQGFHWQSWTGAWSTEFDHGIHRRSLVNRGAGFGFRTEHRFPRANSKVYNEPYVGPPLINLTNITVTPAVPLADGGLAADNVATANVNVGANVAGRKVNWSVLRGTPTFTAGAAARQVGVAATLKAGAMPGSFRLRAEDTVFHNRRIDGNFRLLPVQLQGLRAVLGNVPAGTLSTTVNLTANPGGRTINWTVDAAALAAGVTVAPVANALNLRVRSAIVTRPAAFTGNVNVTATDSVLAARTASIRIRFR